MNASNGTSLFGIRSPHFKKPTMPTEQRDKLLAMHRESRANAGNFSQRKPTKTLFPQLMPLMPIPPVIVWYSFPQIRQVKPTNNFTECRIYVAVVLAVYVILLTILLCRYARRQRLWVYGDDNNGDDNNHHHPTSSSSSPSPPGFFNFSSRKRRRLKALLCCRQPTPENEYPLTGLTTTVDMNADQNIAAV